MPDQPQPIDKEAVRTLAVAIGVREAARKLGLNENRVLQWSRRYEWFKQPEPVKQPPTVTKNDVITVIKPADAMLSEIGKETKLNLVKAAGKAASAFAERSGAAVINSAQALRHITAAASTLHGWEEKGGSQVTLNLGLMIGSIE